MTIAARHPGVQEVLNVMIPWVEANRGQKTYYGFVKGLIDNRAPSSNARGVGQCFKAIGSLPEYRQYRYLCSLVVTKQEWLQWVRMQNAAAERESAHQDVGG